MLTMTSGVPLRENCRLDDRTNQEESPMDLLKELSEASAPPGFEDEIRAICRRELGPLVDEIREDAMGNLIAIKRGTLGEGRKKIMLAGHMDEIGFLVRFVDDDGYLRLNPAGGFDPKTLIAKRVTVMGKTRKLVGLLGTKPIHIMQEEEKKKLPTLDDLFVDLGLPADDVKAEVEIGTPVTLHQPFLSWGDVATGKALDNRVSMWVIIRALQRAKEFPHDVYAVMTSQEEIGIRGATVAAYGVDPDVGVAVDITLACDVPGVDKKDHITKLGEGVAIKVMDSASISHPGLVKTMRAIAEKEGITHQLEILPRGGTDARGIQMAREGKPAITLSVPTRYVHSVVEMLNVEDLGGAADLLARFLEQEALLP
jgi:endoglucanase